ncbi:MAG TPA: DUF2085 domain-containing protein [Ktedonobacteraceae bacterium]|nr:DUF2085 domain-containing protein [Ktedonobacteraceae bacterium]
MAIQRIQQATQAARQPAQATLHNSNLDRVMQKVGDWVLEYWAAAITVGLGALVLTALSIPYLSYFGLDFLSKPLFFALHTVCAQIPSHSFYILGHQVGLCARNLAIYSAMFIGSAIFTFSKKRMKGIPWWFWLLLILPMAWDGVTQMFGLRESTWVLRVITGGLFGFANVWFVLPFMQKTLLETTPPPAMRQPIRPFQQYAPQPIYAVNARQQLHATTATDEQA